MFAFLPETRPAGNIASDVQASGYYCEPDAPDGAISLGVGLKATAYIYGVV